MAASASERISLGASGEREVANHKPSHGGQFKCLHLTLLAAIAP
jgi:hypothetical protein